MGERLRLFDCDCTVGAPRQPLPHVQPSWEDLDAQMARQGIERALVRHIACVEAGPETGNALLLREAGGRRVAVPVWNVPPDLLVELGQPAAVVGHMLAQGVRAAWMTPGAHGYVLAPWCCGPMLTALAERGMPLLVGWDNAPGGAVHEVLSQFPDLRLILLSPPRVGRNRVLYPLMDKHPGLHCVVTPTYSVYRGIEDLCARFGAERLLFGSGYPTVAPGAGLCLLAYADISDEDRQAIARGNIERLLAEVRL